MLTWLEMTKLARNIAYALETIVVASIVAKIILDILRNFSSKLP